MLTLTALVMQTPVFAMEERENALDKVTSLAKQLVRDVREYKKCRNTEEGCSPELIQRLRTAGVRIAAAVGAAIIITGGAILGRRLYKRGAERQRVLKMGSFQQVLPILVDEFKFGDEETNYRLIVAVVQKDIENLRQLVTKADREALKAAKFLAEQRGYKDIADAIENEWMVRAKKSVQ
jgi:hypothetical protein